MGIIQKIPEVLDRGGWALAGMLGALASLPFHSEVNTWRGRLYFLFTGCVCSYYLTDLVAQYFSIDKALAGSIGFLLGAFGGSLISAIVKAIKAADLWELLKNRLGGSN